MKANNGKYEYEVTQPMLPQGATSPVMDSRDMENWLNDMDSRGWEFVGYGQKNWLTDTPQPWWIFRRLRKVKKCPTK